MQSSFISRLCSSLDKLEISIVSAEEGLKDKEGFASEAYERIKSYKEVLAKQRALVSRLEPLIDKEDWDSVSQIIKTVNALSNLIKEDAEEILERTNTASKDLDVFTDKKYCFNA